MAVSRGEALQVGDRFDVPYDDVDHGATTVACAIPMVTK
jgi:hypothetical protein